MLNEIKNYIKDNKPSGITSRLKAHKEYWSEIVNYSIHTQTEKKTEQVYLYINQIEDITCPCGNNKRKFISIVQGHYEFCSQKDFPDCTVRNTAASERRSKTLISNGGYGLANPKAKAKAKATILKKYGVDNVAQIQETKDKVKNTVLERYGVGNVLKNSKIRQQIKETNIERYGVDNVLKSSAVQQQIKKTNIERYGVDNVLKSEIIRQQIKKTNIERYGVDIPSKTDEIKNKAKATNLSRYGHIIPVNTEYIRDKIKKTNIERYGVEHYSMTQESKITQSMNGLNISYPKIIERVNQVVKPNFTIDNYCGVAHQYSWDCVKCGHTFNDHLDNGRTPICRKCYPLAISKGECGVKDFLSGLNIVILDNNRQLIKPKELDIVIPEKKIAIEYCGLYWHGTIIGKDHNYHKNKLNQTNEQGYHLITIFEDEWLNKRDICEARLKHILGINDTTCYARQTTIKEINSKEHKYFLNKHHIQGHVGAKIKLGAYYNDELVAMMSFGKKRRALGNKTQTPDTYELLRFCAKGSIPGMGSKLFKYFTRNYNPEEIISYCDLRWGTGDFYENLGFKLTHISNPNYWYFNNGTLKRYHRFKYRKQALTEMASYSSKKTEWQIMQEEKYDKIYDCGNKVFKWIK